MRSFSLVRTALALREAYAFDKDKTTVLDFACGTGLSSVLSGPSTEI
jgi:hypothetical protein